MQMPPGATNDAQVRVDSLRRLREHYGMIDLYPESPFLELGFPEQVLGGIDRGAEDASRLASFNDFSPGALHDPGIPEGAEELLPVLHVELIHPAICFHKGHLEHSFDPIQEHKSAGYINITIAAGKDSIGVLKEACDIHSGRQFCVVLVGQELAHPSIDSSHLGLH